MKYQRIRDCREDEELTQQQAAEYLQISRSAYANYESGIRELLIDFLPKLADLYHTSIDYLMGRTKNKTL